MRTVVRPARATLVGATALLLSSCGTATEVSDIDIRTPDVVPRLVTELDTGGFTIEFPVCRGAEIAEISVYGREVNDVRPDVVHAAREPIATTATVLATVTAETLSSGYVTDDLPVDTEQTQPFSSNSTVPDDVFGVWVEVGEEWSDFWVEAIDWSVGDRWLIGLGPSGRIEYVPITESEAVDLTTWCRES